MKYRFELPLDTQRMTTELDRASGAKSAERSLGTGTWLCGGIVLGSPNCSLLSSVAFNESA